MNRQAAIVGIGAFPFSKSSGTSEWRMGSLAALEALRDAGLTPRDVDGVFRSTMEATTESAMARGLGIPDVRAFGAVDYGGGGIVPMVSHAALAVESGMAEVVLTWRARVRKSGPRPWMQRGSGGSSDQQHYERVFGIARPVDSTAILARLWAERYNWKPEDLGRIAITIREHARRNPMAMMQRELTMEQYLGSRMIADPLRLFDCCLESDGAVALVLTTAERARDLRPDPAYVTAYAMATGPDSYNISQWYGEPLGRTQGWYAARELWRRTELRPADIDAIQWYDAFTPEVAISFEEYGFCGEGEVMEMLAAGEHAPYNTAGGCMSEAYLHGINLFSEAVRQVRGTSTDQVDGAEHVLVTSGNTTPNGAMILSGSPR
ncbi:lipid-transfer protein [Acrocarpospora macrocephala]|uniref:Lipid-transfer protein n=1 Tax=Acrocarpospora macrocephala TaxID=150177 RepID=A0A5M3WM77_9ACTN|nr:lipid-transfer protein [Acrocarpospora macrocephala]GES09610.1 lipid-transfer protein [Acrocarpospora macrocephala]